MHYKKMVKIQENNIIRIRIHFPEDCNIPEYCNSIGEYYAIKIAKNKYELTENDPFCEFLSYKTRIEIEDFKKEEGVLEFKRVFKKSDFSLEVIGLPMELNETELRKIGKMIIDEGGYWEVIFGGMGYVNLPKTSKLNIINELNNLIKEKGKKAIEKGELLIPENELLNKYEKKPWWKLW